MRPALLPQRVVAETWPELARRLARSIDEPEAMVRHISSRRGAPRRRKRERELRAQLGWAIEWARRWIELGGPMDGEEATELVTSLYEFDLGRAGLMDEFQDLLDEARELFPPR